jgi:hypothetical protein
VAVALDGRCYGRVAQDGIGPGRRHHYGVGMALVQGGVDPGPVVGSCTLMLLFLYAMVEAQAVSPAGPEVAEASDGRLGIGE